MKMRCILIIFISLFSLPPVLAQSFSITGKIVSTATQQPVPQAEVLLTNTGALYIADAKGNYTIPNLAAGTYTLTAYSVGWGSATQQVTMSKGNAVQDFSLKPL